MPISHHRPPAGAVSRYYRNKGQAARSVSVDEGIQRRKVKADGSMQSKREARRAAMQAGVCKPTGE